MKKQKKDRMSSGHKKDSKYKKDLQNLTKDSSVELVPLVVDEETGFFENSELYRELLPTIEEFSNLFGDESLPSVSNYSEWLQFELDFIREVSPWAFIVLADGKPQGLCWLISWWAPGKNYHSVDIGGIAKRGTPIEITQKTIWALLDKAFTETEVYIIRANCAKNNRAASLAMIRAGFTHPEPMRAFMVKGGVEIDAIIRSITRPEWEALKHNVEKEA